MLRLLSNTRLSVKKSIFSSKIIISIIDFVWAWSFCMIRTYLSSTLKPFNSNKKKKNDLIIVIS